MSQSQKDSSNIIIFDRDLIRRNKERSAVNFHDHDFLFKWSRNELSDRISDINRSFDNALQIGYRGGLTSEYHDKIGNIVTIDMVGKPTNFSGNYIQASEEFLPIAPKTMELALSNLSLHTVNDLPGSLLQIKNCLKDDGLFIASIFGGETLYELRKIMSDVEIELYGGISPRIAPFADKLQIGELLGRAGFALPVVDSDIITVTYDNIFKLLHDIRGMGEGNAILARNKTPLGKEFFMRVAQKYAEEFSEDDGRIVASFEVIFMLGWTPHSSQQKPLKRGSAEYSLADVLNGKKESMQDD